MPEEYRGAQASPETPPASGLKGLVGAGLRGADFARPVRHAIQNQISELFVRGEGKIGVRERIERFGEEAGDPNVPALAAAQEHYDPIVQRANRIKVALGSHYGNERTGRRNVSELSDVGLAVQLSAGHLLNQAADMVVPGSTLLKSLYQKIRTGTMPTETGDALVAANVISQGTPEARVRAEDTLYERSAQRLNVKRSYAQERADRGEQWKSIGLIGASEQVPYMALIAAGPFAFIAAEGTARFAELSVDSPERDGAGPWEAAAKAYGGAAISFAIEKYLERLTGPLMGAARRGVSAIVPSQIREVGKNLMARLPKTPALTRAMQEVNRATGFQGLGQEIFAEEGGEALANALLNLNNEYEQAAITPLDPRNALSPGAVPVAGIQLNPSAAAVNVPDALIQFAKEVPDMALSMSILRTGQYGVGIPGYLAGNARRQRDIRTGLKGFGMTDDEINAIPKADRADVFQGLFEASVSKEQAKRVHEALVGDVGGPVAEGKPVDLLRPEAGVRSPEEEGPGQGAAVIEGLDRGVSVAGESPEEIQGEGEAGAIADAVLGSLEPEALPSVAEPPVAAAEVAPPASAIGPMKDAPEDVSKPAAATPTEPVVPSTPASEAGGLSAPGAAVGGEGGKNEELGITNEGGKQPQKVSYWVLDPTDDGIPRFVKSFDNEEQANAAAKDRPGAWVERKETWATDIPSVNGELLASHQTVRTVTGRLTTKFPFVDVRSDRKAQNTVKRANEWLIQNAIDEAVSRADDFAANQFRAALRRPSQSDLDGAHDYLFNPEFAPAGKPKTEKPAGETPVVQGETETGAAKEGKGHKAGDRQKVMGLESTVDRVDRVEWLDYELYRTDDGRGVVRVYDAEAADVVSTRAYPSFEKARDAHADAVQKARKGAGLVQKQEPEQADLEEEATGETEKPAGETETATPPETIKIPREIRKLIKQYRRKERRQYGEAYARWVLAGEQGEGPEYPGLNYMNAQGVRMAIDKAIQDLQRTPSQAETTEQATEKKPTKGQESGTIKAEAEPEPAEEATDESAIRRPDVDDGAGPSGGRVSAETGAAPETKPASGVSGQPDREDLGPADQTTETEGTGVSGKPGAGTTGPRPDSDTESEPGPGETPPAERPEETPEVSGPDKPTSRNQRNHVVREDHTLAPKGQISKIKANIAALKILKRLDEQGRDATPQEQIALATYTGWGHSPQVFDADKGSRMNSAYSWGRDEAWEKKFGKYYTELRDLLTDDEWKQAVRSTLYAHYTSREVVGGMWGLVRRLGFEGGRILEPAMGTGNFFGLMPEDISAQSSLVGAEIEPIAGRIAKYLYPDAQIFIEDFSKVALPDNSIDLAITNVPFANKGPADPRYTEELNLHNYFLARMIDAVKPGGLVVAISSYFTMDANKRQREFLDKRADLIGAIRLPNDAFKANAGTDVVTDILVFRKPDSPNRMGQPWTNLGSVPGAKGEPIPVNEYYQSNPDMMMGTPSLEGSMYRDKEEFTLKSEPDALPLGIRMLRAILNFPQYIFGGQAADYFDFTRLGEAKGERNNSIVIKDGEAAVVQNEQYVDPKKIDKALGSKTARARMKDYVPLRDAYEKHVALMRSDDSTDAQVETSMKALNKQYDAYVKKHGFLHDTRTRMFSFDPRYWFVAGIEEPETVTDPKTKKRKVTWKKAAVFTQRTIRAVVEPTKAESVYDGLLLSLAYRGHVDTGWISNLVSKSRAEVQEELLREKHVYRNPVGGQLEVRDAYLSGNVREKVKIATEIAKKDSQYQSNVDALEKVQPERIPIDKIAFRLGSTFVPESVIEQAVNHVIDGWGRIKYLPEINRWSVDWNQANRSWNVHSTMAQRVIFDGVALLKKAFNLKDPIAKWTVGTGDNKKTVTDPAATVQARDKIEQMHEAFRKYITDTPELARQVEDEYNDKHNNHVLRQWNGEHIVLPGMTNTLTLRSNQKNAIWRMVQEQAGMLAHAVGAGKTYEMIGIAMESRRLRLANKPMIVVQNATLPQFAESFLRMYPTANILVPDKNDLAGKRRKQMFGTIAAGDFDAIIIAQSQFDRIANDPNREAAYIAEIISELQEAAERLRKEEGKKARSVKQLEAQIRRWEIKLVEQQARAQRQSDETALFEELGVDLLLIDEAHAYKKPPFETQLDRLVGLNKETSARGYNLMMKTRYVQERRQGRGVILATGTPVTNTLGEAWHMTRLATPNLLKEYAIEQFDQFITSFATIKNTMTMNAGGAWVTRPSLATFTNGPEFIKFIRSSWDVVTTEMLHDLLEKMGTSLPRRRGGSTEIVAVPLTDAVDNFILYVMNLYEAFQQLNGDDKKRYSYIPVQGFMAARAAAIDARLVDPNAPDEPGSKVNTMIRSVLEIYHDTAADHSTQAIFSDTQSKFNTTLLDAFLQRPEDDNAPEIVVEDSDETEAVESKGFLFQDIRNKLIEGGVKPSEIAFAGDAVKDEQKEALWKKVNSGEIRIILGSTAKMGIGVNIQEKLIALHHLDAPFLPADIEQREGRIIRAGNENEEVIIRVYGMEKTMDAATYAMLLRKAKFIRQTLAGEITDREFEDPGGGLIPTYEQQMAMLSGNPLAFEKIELETDLRTLRALESQYIDDRARLRNDMLWGEDRLKTAKKDLAKYEADAKTAENEIKPDAPVTFNGQTMDLKTFITTATPILEEARKANFEASKKRKLPSARNGWEDAHIALQFKVGPVEVKMLSGGVGSIERTYDKEGKEKLKTTWEQADSAHITYRNSTVGYDIADLNQILRKVAEIPEDKKQAVDGYLTYTIPSIEKQIAEYKEQIAQPFARADELKEKTERLAKVDKELLGEKDEDEKKGPRKSQTKALARLRRGIDTTVQADDGEFGARMEVDRQRTHGRPGEPLTPYERREYSEAAGAPRGMAAGDAKRAIKPLVKRWTNAPKRFEVVQSVEDVPEQYRRPNMRGVFIPDIDTVYVVADNLDTAEQAVFVALHEVVGHRGIEGILGPQRATSFYARLVRGRKRDIEAYAKVVKMPFSTPGERIRAAKEWLADRVGRGELGDAAKWWEKLLDLIRAAVDRILGREATDAELRRLARAAVGFAEGGMREEISSQPQPLYSTVEPPPLPEEEGTGEDANVSSDVRSASRPGDAGDFGKSPPPLPEEEDVAPRTPPPLPEEDEGAGEASYQQDWVRDVVRGIQEEAAQHWAKEPKEYVAATLEVLKNLPALAKNLRARDKNAKPDLNLFDFTRMPQHAFEKVSTLFRGWKTTETRVDEKNQYDNIQFNAKPGQQSDLAVWIGLRKGSTKVYRAVQKYLIGRDRNAWSYKVRFNTKTKQWDVLEIVERTFTLRATKPRPERAPRGWKAPKPYSAAFPNQAMLRAKAAELRAQGWVTTSDYKDTHRVVDRAADEEGAWETAYGREQADLASVGMPEAGRAAIAAWRRVMDRNLLLRMGQVNEIMEAMGEDGLTEDEQQTRNELAQMVQDMGQLRGHYFPRQYQPGKWVLKATKGGERIRKGYDLQWSRAVAKTYYEKGRGYKTDIEISSQTSEDAFRRAGTILAQYDQFQHVIERLAEKAGDTDASFEQFGMAVREETYTTKKGETEQWLKIEAPNTKAYNDVFMAIPGHGAWDSDQTAEVKEAGRKVWSFPNPSAELKRAILSAYSQNWVQRETVNQFAQAFLQEYANQIKSHGSQSAKIARGRAVGTEVSGGYETDPILAMTRAVTSTSGGLAKRNMSRRMLAIFTGTEQTWKQYKREHADELDGLTGVMLAIHKRDQWLAYQAEVNARRLSSSTQEHAFDAAQTLYDNAMRNETGVERMVGVVRGLAAVKYLSRLFSGFVNVTILATTYPAVMHGFHDIPFARTAAAMRIVAKEYPKYWAAAWKGKRYRGDPNLARAFDYMEERGWTEAQYNREALAAVQSKMGRAFSVISEKLMFSMGMTEKFNRAVAIGSAYVAIRERMEKAGTWTDERFVEAMDEARAASDKTNQLYHTANIPIKGQGPGVGAQAFRSWYMFQRITHGQLDVLFQLGLRKKDAKAVAWMLAAPAILAGPAASYAFPFALAAIKAVLALIPGVQPPEDDPDAWLWDQIAEWLGEGAPSYLRYGVAGAFGVNLQGSLALMDRIPNRWQQVFPTLEDIGGAPLSVVKEAIEGIGSVAHGDVYRGVEKLVPSMVASPMRAYREYADGVTGRDNSKRFYGGEQLQPDAYQTFLRALGANPRAISEKLNEQYGEYLVEQNYGDLKSAVRDRYVHWAIYDGRAGDEYTEILTIRKGFNDRVDAMKPRGVTYITDDTLRTWVRNATQPPKKERERR